MNQLLYPLFLRCLQAAAALLLLLAGARARAQAPDWQQAVGVDARVMDVAADAAGNVYVVGNYTGTLKLGSTSLPATVGLGGTNGFVAKWSPATNDFVWAKLMGDGSADHATNVVVQGAAVYVAGYFSGATTVLGATILTNAGTSTGSDLFVAKLLDAGTSASYVWAERAGGRLAEETTALAVSGNSLYVAGEFEGSAVFGPAVLTSAGYTDGYVAKFTDSGAAASLAWAEAISTDGFDKVWDLVAQGSDLYLVGEVLGPTATFGALTVPTVSAMYADMFVAKLVDTGSAGRFAWAQVAGGALYDTAYALAVSGENIYVSGFFHSATVQFGSLLLPNSSPADTDAYVAKMLDNGTAGTFVWVQSLTGPSYEQPKGMAVRGSVVYLGGYFNQPAMTIGGTTLTSRGDSDLFVARFSDRGATGHLDWVQQAGGPQGDYTNALALVGTNVYLAGGVTRPASFGSHLLEGPTRPGFYLTGCFALLSDTYQALATTPATLGSGLDLYPNPARTAVTVQVPASVSVPATLTLLSALGQVVRTQAMPAAATSAVLPLQGLAPGLYQLRAQAGGWHAVQTLAVE